jgi:hypothetical protein
MQRPRFGPWSVSDVVFGLAAIFGAPLSVFFVAAAVYTVVTREGWWPFRVLGYLTFAAWAGRATKASYRRVGAPSSGR